MGYQYGSIGLGYALCVYRHHARMIDYCTEFHDLGLRLC